MIPTDAEEVVVDTAVYVGRDLFQLAYVGAGCAVKSVLVGANWRFLI